MARTTRSESPGYHKRKSTLNDEIKKVQDRARKQLHDRQIKLMKEMDENEQRMKRVQQDKRHG